MKKSAKKNGNGAVKAAPVKDEIMVLGGRRFLMTQATTFRQDARMVELAEKTGLVGLFMELAAKPGQTVDAGMIRGIIGTAFQKGTLFQMLATAMREEGQPRWTQERADEVAEFLADLTDPDDKDKLNNGILGILLGFFVAARHVWGASPPSAANPTSSPSPAIPSSTDPIGALSVASRGPG